ncbi:MAG TPA: HNH endonuclease, partial [Thermoanaerobaculia bacterium]
LTEWMSAGGIARSDLTQNHVDAYLDELVLVGDVEELASNIVEEVFFHLFGNRSCLLAFNELMANIVIKDLGPDQVDPEHVAHFAAAGVLRRSELPEWVKHAVFFRDRGMCVLCQRDLSRLVTVEPEENYDHMVPLSRGGLNDVTNIQLLCSTCNVAKADTAGSTSCRYERWF